MKKEPWEKELEKHDGPRCEHEWAEPFDGRVKCKKCGTYQLSQDDLDRMTTTERSRQRRHMKLQCQGPEPRPSKRLPGSAPRRLSTRR